MSEISRRSVIVGAAAAAATVVVGVGAAVGIGALADGGADTGAKRSAPPTPEPAEPAPLADAVDAVDASGAPARVPSFGPNGTHWPAHTPVPGGPGVRTVDVDCTWKAIGAAIAAATDADIAQGLHVRVRPGALPGFGAAASAAPVLANLGKATWPKNVLVSPRDGWGTVTIADSMRLDRVLGVTFARFTARFILLTDCSRTCVAQTKVQTGLRITASKTDVTQCDVYEVVMPDSRIDTNDPFGYATGEGASLSASTWEGCYIAPVFRPAGGDQHLDALQMYGRGFTRGLTVRDSVVFGGLNCALQLGGPHPNDPNLGTPYFTLDHSIAAAQLFAVRTRYPTPDGAHQATLAQAINGTGEPGQLYAYDSLVLGSLYDTSWGEVQRSATSYLKARSKNPSRSGGWNVDPSLSEWSAADIDALAPRPTDDLLARIWR
ncbi:hypothetical protein [Agromyces larvae]|uniref:Uncharacterized protein n=1 Tax=Agromyces larvae TaxID=2929802 RepID=A0ABY4BYR7_9MICO|nr:hypothetical protein [Agromyces larvae]UOE44325.1 hypothetical protein MTO99_00580 [Agromyces larvae]